MSNAGKVLVVEDEPDILSLVVRHLKANGFLPNGFSDPVEALEEFENDASQYSVVLTDVRMPAMSGLQLAQKVFRINPQAKVVLMTAFEVEASDLKGLPAISIDDIISKPFKLTEICSRVKKITRAA